MILGQYNILGFYTTKEARVWNRLLADGGNYELFRIFLETNKLPAIQLIVDSGDEHVYLYLLDSTDSVVGSYVEMTVEENTQIGITYDRLIYAGSTLSGNTDGDYSLKIVNGANTYYSDVFGWTSDSDYLDDMVKISATSSDIRIGKYYKANLDAFTFECYINAEYNGIEPEVEETVQVKYGVSNPVYSNLVETREFDVYGTEYILRFLLGLRILETNGVVTITWKSVDYVANDIMSEKTEDHSPDIMQIKLSFIVVNEILGTLNDV